MKYLRVYRIQIKNNWVRAAVYRNNFLTAAVTDLVWIWVEYMFFTVIYANTPVLAGWTREQVYFFLGIFFAADSLHTIFFQGNFWLFSDLVNKGDLDIVLTKPIHPLFLALTKTINLTAVFNTVLGLAICIRYAHAAGFEGGVKWLLLPLWLLVGMTIQLLTRFLSATSVFWTERSFAFTRLHYQLYQFASKPDAVYPQVLRCMILSVIPFAFIASVPARALLHGLHTGEYLVLFCVIAGFFTVDLFVWRAGLKRYQSASS